MKAKLKGKDKEVAKAAQEFIEGPCGDYTVDLFFDDFELDKEDKEIFQDPYTKFEALCKTKLKKAFRDQEEEIGDKTVSKKRVKYLRECINPAVNSLKVIPNTDELKGKITAEVEKVAIEYEMKAKALLEGNKTGKVAIEQPIEEVKELD